MVCQTTKDAPALTKQINVTDLTASQKRQIFIEHLSLAGFIAFDKKKIGEETYYAFTCKNTGV